MADGAVDVADAADAVADEWRDFNARLACSHPPFGAPLPPAPPLGPQFASNDELQRSLAVLRQRYHLTDEQHAEWADRGCIRLRGCIPPGVLSMARERICALASRATGGVDASLPSTPPPPSDGTPEGNAARWRVLAEPSTRSWHIQQVWAVDPVVRALVLSPRVGEIVRELLGCQTVRLYHDNVLSRAPGSKHTRWHCDDGPNGYMACGGDQVVTVWVPLHRTTPEHGSLVFPRAASGGGKCPNSWDVAAEQAQRGAPKVDEQSDAYHDLVSAALERSGAAPDEATYEMGDLSIHATGVFHCTGGNLTDGPRVIIGTTYFADGGTLRTDIDPSTLTQGQRNDWNKFAPGVQPGEPIATKFNPLLQGCEG